MKTYVKSILALATAVLLGLSAWAASQTTTASTTVGSTKTGVTSTSNVTGSNRTWSQQTAADSSVAKVTNTGGISSSKAKKPTISVNGVGAGYTTFVAKNDASSGTDKGLTFTCNITVTDS